MTNPIVTGVGVGKQLLVGMLGFLAFIMPITFGILTTTATPAGAQARNAQLARFEAISIRPVPLGLTGRTGGPGSTSPEQISFQSVALGGLIREAFGVDEDQISAPGWIYLENYAVTAKIPPGTEHEQFRIMLQNMLADRFHLAIHHATRESPGYELVTAEGRVKLRDSGLASNAFARHAIGPGDSHTFPVDKDGFPQLGDIKGMAVRTAQDGRDLETCQSCSIGVLVRQAANQVGTWTPSGSDAPIFVPAIVVDKTGLTGEYDFTLAFRGKEGGDTEFSGVLENQLGLKLQKVERIPIDVLVVDHADKVPTEN